MRQKPIFKINGKEYERNKYSLQKDRNPININDVDIKKIVLSNKTPYGKQGANKYYIAYLNGGFKPLYISIKNIETYTNRMYVLANDNELLKYIEVWNKIEALFNKKFNRKSFHSDPAHNNEYIRTKISSYNENFRDFQKLVKDKYCGHSK